MKNEAIFTGNIGFETHDGEGFVVFKKITRKKDYNEFFDSKGVTLPPGLICGIQTSINDATEVNDIMIKQIEHNLKQINMVLDAVFMYGGKTWLKVCNESFNTNKIPYGMTLFTLPKQ